MLAVIEMGGKQYRVAPKQIFYAELTGTEEGKEIEIKNVLLIQDKDNIQVGKPYIKNASVKAKVIQEEKGPKLRGFKYKKRKNYHLRWGHRQRYQKLEILSISA
ncbi:MAG: 50S ribosomal protein L21 [Spirochaetia bacterium]|nr:50S ribosomal protein L21 [Spirochaetia bacterium]